MKLIVEKSDGWYKLYEESGLEERGYSYEEFCSCFIEPKFSRKTAIKKSTLKQDGLKTFLREHQDHSYKNYLDVMSRQPEYIQYLEQKGRKDADPYLYETSKAYSRAKGKVMEEEEGYIILDGEGELQPIISKKEHQRIVAKALKKQKGKQQP